MGYHATPPPPRRRRRHAAAPGPSAPTVAARLKTPSRVPAQRRPGLAGSPTPTPSHDGVGRAVSEGRSGHFPRRRGRADSGGLDRRESSDGRGRRDHSPLCQRFNPQTGPPRPELAGVGSTAAGCLLEGWVSGCPDPRQFSIGTNGGPTVGISRNFFGGPILGLESPGQMEIHPNIRRDAAPGAGGRYGARRGRAAAGRNRTSRFRRGSERLPAGDPRSDESWHLRSEAWWRWPKGSRSRWTIVVPDPGPGEAVVRVQACGVCHTDLHYREGGINDDFPFLLGHEAAGVVEAVGAGRAPRWRPGTSWSSTGERCAASAGRAGGAGPGTASPPTTPPRR